MLVLLDGVANIEGLAGMDVVEVPRHIEGYAVDYLARGVIDQLQLDVLQVLAHQHASAKVLDVARAECRLLVAGSVGVE